MTFHLRPTIYSLLLCSSVEPDENTGGWILRPFSHVTVQAMPVELELAVFAHIMAPPGGYELALRLFHTAEPDDQQVLPARPFTVHEGKNVDFMVHVEARITQAGLYIVEADLLDHDRAVTPLRMSLA